MDKTIRKINAAPIYLHFYIMKKLLSRPTKKKKVTSR